MPPPPRESAALPLSFRYLARNASTTPLAGTADGRRWAGGAGRGPRFAGLTRPRNSRGRGLVAPRMIWPSAHGGRAEGLSAPEGLPRVGELRAARRREGGSSSGAARGGPRAAPRGRARLRSQELIQIRADGDVRPGGPWRQLSLSDVLCVRSIDACSRPGPRYHNFICYSFRSAFCSAQRSKEGTHRTAGRLNCKCSKIDTEQI